MACVVAAVAASTIASSVTSTVTAVTVPERHQLGPGPLELDWVLVPQGHRGAGAKQPPGNSLTDALRTAGDDGASAIEIDLVHVFPLPGGMRWPRRHHLLLS